MIRLDVPTVMLQWATGGLVFLWVTSRHRLVSLGYGWLLRLVFGLMAAVAVATNPLAPSTGRTVFSAGAVVAAAVALLVSVLRRRAGVSGANAVAQRRKARVAVMAGRGSAADAGEAATAAILMRDQFGRLSLEAERIGRDRADGPEFPPSLDLVAPALGMLGLVFAGEAAAGNDANALLGVARTIMGALFLGAVSDAMLLGHWYLTQPGLTRRPIVELNEWLLRLWPFEVALLLVPQGMVQVVNGSIDDKWGGMLGWMWIACALSTGALAYVTKLALRERFYSAVMAATGLLYLAILTAFGTDIVARAVLNG